MAKGNIYAGKKCFRHPDKPAYGDISNSKGHYYLCYPCWYAYDKEFNRRLRIQEDKQWGDQDWYRAAFPRRFKVKSPEQPKLL